MWKLTYEQETTPGYGIYLKTGYGRTFTTVGALQEIRRVKRHGRRIRNIRLSYAWPNFRSWFWPKCEDCGVRFNTEYCQECCEHEWDPDEGGMCINCGRDDYYNFIGD